MFKKYSRKNVSEADKNKFVKALQQDIIREHYYGPYGLFKYYCAPNYPTLETLFKCEHALYFIALTKFKDKDNDLSVLNDIESRLLAVNKILAKLTPNDEIFTHPRLNNKKYWEKRADILLKCVELFRTSGKPVTTSECKKVTPSALTGKPWRFVPEFKKTLDKVPLVE
ncbi:hypothetical protein [Taylorella equigenitalis]|uniref:hypothetical protein n=1 Tax=Taylorella equigenitalis TaxID=29575 RepID=UPI000F84E3DE|nr:hypothetical protein [Taylorella equigenitalis]